MAHTSNGILCKCKERKRDTDSDEMKNVSMHG